MTLNLPLFEGLDLGMSLWYFGMTDQNDPYSDFKLSRLTGEVMLHLSLLPGRRFNPFLSLGYFGQSTTRRERWREEKSSESGYTYGGGLELQVAPRTGLILSAREVVLEESRSLAGQAVIQYWFNPTVAGRLGVSHFSEPESNSAFIGVIFNL